MCLVFYSSAGTSGTGNDTQRVRDMDTILRSIQIMNTQADAALASGDRTLAAMIQKRADAQCALVIAMQYAARTI